LPGSKHRRQQGVETKGRLQFSNWFSGDDNLVASAAMDNIATPTATSPPSGSCRGLCSTQKTGSTFSNHTHCPTAGKEVGSKGAEVVGAWFPPPLQPPKRPNGIRPNQPIPGRDALYRVWRLEVASSSLTGFLATTTWLLRPRWTTSPRQQQRLLQVVPVEACVLLNEQARRFPATPTA
jgi:hypothetical protein